ncbi:MAG: alpha/beta fold hydrolase [Mycobacteriaceae bacterium]|nr:alpha/beta fold hydrolase [Mycobacteriaceae bacterium]
MKQSTRRSGVQAAIVVAASILAVGLGAYGGAYAAPGPGADPSAPVTEQQLADYISAGLHRTPKGEVVRAVADSGSADSTGSACTSGSGAGSGNGSGDCYGGSGSSTGSAGGHYSVPSGYGPAMTSWVGAFTYGLFNPNAGAPGTNDWNCKPSAAHPRPVVLVHGTWMNAYNGAAYLAPELKKDGYCLFALNYGQSNLVQGGGLGPILPGINGTGYIEDSAKQLSQFVDRVLAATGTQQVDMIAHSQGGVMARYYQKFAGGQGKVKKMVTMGSTHHGTALVGIGALGRAVNNLGIDVLGLVEVFVGHAGIQQTVGSTFIHKVNAGGDTVPGTDYTVIATRYDEVTNPYPLTFLNPGPGATVTNVTLQDGCEQDLSDHLTMQYSPRALSVIRRALDPAGNHRPVCTFNPWLVGGAGSL